MTIPLDIIDDLCSRFVVNIPQEERKDLIRVCFQIELAYWFYIDYYCTTDQQLPKCQYNEFAKIIFTNVPFLQQHLVDLSQTIERWRDYKMAVPTYGAILLDKELDHVLLVQGFWARSSWGFPKGKVNADEDPVVCACREVLEETGFDCRPIVSAKDYIELHIQDTLIRLYIVTGVDRETIFKPLTRCEIKNCSWFKISELPMTRRDNSVTIENKAFKPSAFFMTIPFIKPLRKWISRRRKSLANESTSICDISACETSICDNSICEKINSDGDADLETTSPKRQKYWSTTWENVKIDWDQVMAALEDKHLRNSHQLRSGALDYSKRSFVKSNNVMAMDTSCR